MISTLCVCSPLHRSSEVVLFAQPMHDPVFVKTEIRFASGWSWFLASLGFYTLKENVRGTTKNTWTCFESENIRRFFDSTALLRDLRIVFVQLRYCSRFVVHWTGRKKSCQWNRRNPSALDDEWLPEGTTSLIDFLLKLYFVENVNSAVCHVLPQALRFQSFCNQKREKVFIPFYIAQA